MRPVRLGAVGYLNARPLVRGLERSPRFALRYDLPSECARLLASGDVDLGLIPSIQYLQDDAYRIVPHVAIASRGPVASVALFTTRPMREVRSILMDTSSRTSVALVRVLCARLFGIDPAIDAHAPDLDTMLGRADAALVIGDKALLAGPMTAAGRVEKVDLGAAWTFLTGLPFVWAFWTGRAGAIGRDDIDALRAARDAGVAQSDLVAEEYFRDQPSCGEIGKKYLRHNIQYDLGADERAGLELFYQYAAEIGVAPGGSADRALRFY
jgi:chorismate dehydratase